MILFIGNLVFAIYSSEFIIPQERSKLVSLNVKQTQEKQGPNRIQESMKKCLDSGDSQLTQRKGYKVKECKIESWMTIEMDNQGRSIYCGKAVMERIILDLYQVQLNNKKLLNQQTLPDHLRNNLTGLWSIELKEDKVKSFSAWMIVKYSDYKIPKILFTKITGDHNLPAGKVTLQTYGIPLPGSGDSWPGKILIRKDKNDPNGFEWINVSIQRPSLNKIITTSDKNDTSNNSPEAQNIQIELTHYNIDK